MIIHGLQKLTLLDFPERVACTVFTGGCNFRCPFCHNAGLVTNPAGEGVVDTEEFFAYINKRKKVLEGVCVTGGEPLINGDIFDFIARIKDTGLPVKLDTNGSFPHKLKALIDTGLINYVAMDIKNSKEKYPLTSGVASLDVAPIIESAKILMEGKIDFEFRTTVVREFHTSADMEDIGKWLCGDEKFFLQNFVNSGNIIKDGLSGFSRVELEMLRDSIAKYIQNAQIRG